MKPSLLLIALTFAFASASFGASGSVELPEGVKAVWQLEKAYREATPTMQRVCLNGLWRWQPASDPKSENVPDESWGWFKVPGAWPGMTDYMQKDAQTLFRHASWKDANLREVTAAWQEREFTVPENWKRRRITLHAEYLNSFAAVFVDGKKVGEMRFPAGQVDITSHCEPARTHKLTMLVVALPLKAVLQSYTDSASARTVKGTVARRGTCGNIFLVGSVSGPRISEAKVDTYVRSGRIRFRVNVTNHLSGTLRARVRVTAPDGEVMEATGTAMKGGGTGIMGVGFGKRWKPKNLWDIHTPTNQCEAVFSLIDENDRVVDQALPMKFGFREFSIEGRDFYLNGSRIFLSAVPLDNAEVGAAWATYEGAKESLERLKSFGINFVYTHNYGCEPGSHLSFAEVLKAADDVGMLVALSQPHFSHYDWKPGKPSDKEEPPAEGYTEHARFYTRVAGSHPSVILYSMSHNATGYSEDMNPFMIDGVQAPRDQWAERNTAKALRAENVVRALDFSRPIYHHASGNLGIMHNMNFYPNFVPIQELSDWFGHWSTNGVKPAFMCEYGAPFTWDWTMYRGWYKGEREFGSAKVPWEFCVAEWNAQFVGDVAYKSSQAEKTNLRWEAKQFRAGNTWHRWDYPASVGSDRFDERYPIFERYLTDNWRAFRGWGVSGISPWEHEHFWKLRDGVKRARVELKTDWDNLQRPGYSPDYIDQRYERMDLAFERSDWIATPAAQALLRNNMPLLAFIGGKSEAFTSKDHNFNPGETVEKQIIVINNSRKTISAQCEWAFGKLTGKSDVTIDTGDQKRVPVRFRLPEDAAPGLYELTAIVRFGNGEVQSDAFKINIVAATKSPVIKGSVALFDPLGQTRAWLVRNSINFQRVDADADLSSSDILIVGKRALTLTNRAPDISRVAAGLKVLIFEQTGVVLEKRFGFRVEEYGLRNVFARVADHPALNGIAAENLRDWRGEATLLPGKLDYEMRPRYGPTIQWCDIPVTRVWRCGNRGNVASALIEKPACGDFLPIVDGGYALQYSPLLEYREGAGVVIFCQLDVTGRTENDPAAERIANNLLEYVSNWKAAPRRSVTYEGDPAAREFLKSIGIKLGGGELLVVGPGASVDTNGFKSILALGLTASDLKNFGVTSKEAEHISSYFESAPVDSAFAGVSSANVHNRDPRTISLVSGGADVVGNGVLARYRNVVFCQLAPWQFDGERMNLRRTRRHVAVLVSRLLGNLGADSTTPIVNRFSAQVTRGEQRWRDGLYVDQPQEWDDPYRFFRW